MLSLEERIVAMYAPFGLGRDWEDARRRNRLAIGRTWSMVRLTLQ